MPILQPDRCPEKPPSRPEQRTPGRPSLECPFTAVNGSQARRLPLRSHVVSSPVGVSDAKLRRPIDERTIRLLDQELIRRVIARSIPAEPPEACAAWRAGWCSRPKDFRLRSLGARSQRGRSAGAPRSRGARGWAAWDTGGPCTGAVHAQVHGPLRAGVTACAVARRRSPRWSPTRMRSTYLSSGLLQASKSGVPDRAVMLCGGSVRRILHRACP